MNNENNPSGVVEDSGHEELPVAVPTEHFVPPRKKLAVKHKLTLLVVLAVIIAILFVAFR